MLQNGSPMRQTPETPNNVDEPASKKHGVELTHSRLAAPGGPNQQKGLHVAQAPSGEPKKPPHVPAGGEDSRRVRRQGRQQRG